MTLEEIQAEGAAGYRLFDFFTRANGYRLVMIGLLAAAILVFAFRRNQGWAWWTMWLLPAWVVSAVAFYLVAGVEPDQPPPPPMISGPIVAILSAAALLVSAPRFFGRGPAGWTTSNSGAWPAPPGARPRCLRPPGR